MVTLSDCIVGEDFAGTAGVLADFDGEEMPHGTLMPARGCSGFTPAIGCPFTMIASSFLHKNCRTRGWCAGVACDAHETSAGLHHCMACNKIITVQVFIDTAIRYVETIS